MREHRDRPSYPLIFLAVSQQAAQTDYPARLQPKNRPQAYPQRYVEDLFEARTQLEVYVNRVISFKSTD